MRPDLVNFMRPDLVNFKSSGVIIECEEAIDGTFFTTVLTHANLFKDAPIPLDEIEVDVSLSDGKLCKCQVLTCDPHYNLAALRIITDSPLPKMRSLDDFVILGPTQHLEQKSFQLRPHSDTFRCSPGDKLIALARPTKGRYNLYIECCNFSMQSSSLNCKELFCLKGIRKGKVFSGGPVINYSGEMIGIMFHESSFLPSNIISRWWKHYKSYRELRRPWIGFGVANLCAVHVGFLEHLIRKFPRVSTGVLVTKVERDSPAYCSGICESDVITEVDGEAVHNTLEFFEKTWDKVGGSVELTVLRESTGGQLNLTIMISEVTSDKFYSWLKGYKERHK